MRTDRRPARRKASREFDLSGAQEAIAVPAPELLKPIVEEIARARREGSRAGLSAACLAFVETLTRFYEVPPPSVKLLGPRPHSTYEGHLSYELFGDYDLGRARIRLWTQTPMRKRWTSERTLLSTLCHEFMHHLDVRHLGFPHTFHTVGFYQRTHRLYLAALDKPYYPIEFRDRRIDWAATARRRNEIVAAERGPSSPEPITPEASQARAASLEWLKELQRSQVPESAPAPSPCRPKRHEP